MSISDTLENQPSHTADVPPPVPQGPWWRRPKVAAVAGVTAAAVLGATIAGVTVLASNSLHHDRAPGNYYNQDPTAVAKQLHVCDDPTSTSPTIATCKFADGSGGVIVSTTSSELNQGYAVAIIRDNSPAWCTAVLTGALVIANDELSLTKAVGVPELFVTEHHGYLACPGH